MNEIAEKTPVSTTRELPAGTKLALAGLGVGIVGLLVQWAADASKFNGANKTFGLPFPPGILFIAAFGLLTLLTRRWRWHPLPSVLIALWIAVGGAASGQLGPNLTSSNLGTVVGNVVMCAGLLLAFVAGIAAIVRPGRASD